MKGYLFVTEEGWFVVYDQRTFQDPSAEDGILPVHPDNIADSSFNFYHGKEVEFEQIELVDKLDSYQNCIFKTYAKIITTNSKKDRTCNHTNCIEICPECKLPSDILKNVISFNPDWNEEPLNYYSEDFGKDCEAVKNWDSFVEKKNNELEVEKLADIFLKEEWQKDDDQIKFGIKVGFVEGYNQAMVNSQFTISDDVLFEQATVAMEEVYGYGCETEIDAYFRGAKWILKQFKNK